MRYTLLIYDGKPMDASRLEATLVEHKALQAELAAKNALVQVAQLAADPAPVEPSAEGLAEDGPFVELKELLVGFYLVEAEHIAQAQGWARRLERTGVRVAVRPVVWSLDA